MYAWVPPSTFCLFTFQPSEPLFSRRPPRHPTILSKMHSFALTFAATLFFGAVSSALPIVPQVGGVANIATSAVTDVNNVVPRDDVRGIAVILTDAQGKLLPLAQQICTPSLFHFVDDG